jgi:hypothetical protein
VGRGKFEGEATATPRKSTALCSCFKVSKILQDFSSHRIFERMHGALNIYKK